MDRNYSDQVYKIKDEKYIDSFKIDLVTREETNLGLLPTKVPRETAKYLFARNNQHTEVPGDSKQGGKWMLYVPSQHVNKVWLKLVKGVAAGKLWAAKVTTSDPDGVHGIMIYTINSNDLTDVIRVLDYLEANLREANVKLKRSIRYKTNKQTKAGIYTGGSVQPWIYDAETIRSTISESVASTSASTSAASSAAAQRSEPTASSAPTAPRPAIYMPPAFRAQKPVLHNIRKSPPADSVLEQQLAATRISPSQTSASLFQISAASSASRESNRPTRHEDENPASVATSLSQSVDALETREKLSPQQ